MVAREDHHEKIYATMLCKRLTYLELRFVSSATRGRGGGGGRRERKGTNPRLIEWLGLDGLWHG
jgi:hypothetical protein